MDETQPTPAAINIAALLERTFTGEPKPLPPPSTTLQAVYLFPNAGIRLDVELRVLGHLPAIIGEYYQLIPENNGWTAETEQWFIRPLRSTHFDVLNNNRTLDLGISEDAVDDTLPNISLFMGMLVASGWLVEEQPYNPNE